MQERAIAGSILAELLGLILGESREVETKLIDMDYHKKFFKMWQVAVAGGHKVILALSKSDSLTITLPLFLVRGNYYQHKDEQWAKEVVMPFMSKNVYSKINVRADSLIRLGQIIAPYHPVQQSGRKGKPDGGAE